MSIKQRNIFWGFMFFLHAVGFVISVKISPEMRDSSEYIHAAESFDKQGNFYCFDSNQPVDYRGFTKRPMAYPLLIWLTGQNKTLLLLFQNLLSLFNIWFIHKLLYQQFPGLNLSNKHFVIYLLVWLFSISQVIYANLVMADLMLQTMVIAFIYWGFEVFKEKKPLAWVWLSMVVIGAVFTKPVAVFWVYLLPLLFLLQIFRRVVLPKWLILVVLLPLTLYHVDSYHNKQLTGLYHFSSISQINLLHYNTRYMLISKYKSAEEADKILYPLMVKTDTKAAYVKNSKETQKACRELIIENWGIYAKIHLLGMARMLLDPGRFDLYTFLKLDENDKSGVMERSMSDKNAVGNYIKKQPLGLLLLLLGVLIFNLVKVIALVAFILNKNISLLFKVFMAGMILYLVGLTGPIGASRFLLPVLPLMAITVLCWKYKTPTNLQENPKLDSIKA